ncbi:MAG: hypothetical protein EA351_10735 [Gemmatimonadales bacterium]|nr:MAG: hypothetical protein EA351_10735 [Gemmatimonadales bacterium]
MLRLLSIALVTLSVTATSAQAQDPDGGLSTAEQILAQARGHDDPEVRRQLYELIEDRAVRALDADPDDLEARWWLIAAKGLRVDEVSPRAKIRLASEVHEDANRILAADSLHPGAHHAMARIHAGIMRLNPVVRYIAVRLVGESTLRQAAWEEAEQHIAQAMEREPEALVHRYELVRMLQSQARYDEAEDVLDTLFALPDRRPMDPVIRDRALTLREELP